MNQAERRAYLITALLKESPRYRALDVPDTAEEQRTLLRSLMNVRMPAPIDDDVLAVQDAYLKEALQQMGITKLSDLEPVLDGIYLWQGDITTLACDAIVNAANSGMTGCYAPCHNCIDNCIHTFAGMQLRLTCAELMDEQGFEEPTGQAKLTPAYNLPCRYVLHTVGPIVNGRLTKRHEELLESCYRACLQLAREHGLRSVAFCCISTGVFGFPKPRAAEIAVRTVMDERRLYADTPEVIFDVFSDGDRKLYQSVLKSVAP